ncbi:GAF domain-containing protein [Chromobacterium alkanivorans]|uniref:GAF domain-containing protein n=1 Tax=Chromobacterium TaxID=535 RepID=UPI000653DDC7|nr:MULTISPECIES: GAF domain-containing protein [Chromobacterium]KMN77181.1 diguanylate cyclase [Chromobacterium sp. LK11]MBN3003046.1 GAF domain-containing protein [Chromobacterium alkanivorans]MCS3803782.1 GAF domain-containing protein [Chromobacterium alkanivorans]MCS3818113.1 GAF domain-containing protein [Chromobacterium alkanivorans]MCS3874688.1 GAF domain-containing protein [Chromobacterium alkanivorans]
MAEQLIIHGADKQERYQTLLPQALALIESETDQIAALANLCAALHGSFDWLWTGFYLVKDKQLVLGPFQGPIACTRIPFGKGVCGSAWQAGKTLVVEDVDAFPGHIACSSSARSEIVVPIRNAAGEVAAVLDVDSSELASFDAVDAEYLERIAAGLARLL